MSFDPVALTAGLAGCDVTALDITGVVNTTHTARQLRGWLDSIDAALNQRAEQLNTQGAGVPAAELQTHAGGVSAKEARRRERRAKVLERAPSMAAALAVGAVSAEHADALGNATKDLNDELTDRFFEREQSLSEAAKSESPDVFRRRCRDLVITLQAQAGIDRDARQRAATRLTRKIGLDGMHHIHAILHPELGAAVFAALDAETASLAAADDDRDRQQLAAQALGNLVSGGHQHRRPHIPEIIAIFDGMTLLDHTHEPTVSELHNGTPVLPASIRRWLCQGRIVPIITDQHGNPFNMGRQIRTANRAQRRALRTIYRTCAWHGCDTTFEMCEIHHILPWELDGPTDLINLLPLCAKHHHMAHEGNWTLQLDPLDRTLRIYRPDGHLHATTGIHIRPTKRTTPPRIPLAC